MHKIATPAFVVDRGRAMFPAKALDPAKTAVVAVDFQRFFIDDGQPMGTVHARDIIANANAIHKAVRNAGGTVIFTQHSFGATGSTEQHERLASGGMTLMPGNPSFEIHPDMDRDEADLSVVKYQSSPLHPKSGSALGELLEKAAIETLVITGYASNGCCESLARDAFQHGFDVVFASDATATMCDEEHNAALISLGLYYARVRSTDQIVAALGNAGSTI